MQNIKKGVYIQYPYQEINYKSNDELVNKEKNPKISKKCQREDDKTNRF